MFRKAMRVIAEVEQVPLDQERLRQHRLGVPASELQLSKLQGWCEVWTEGAGDELRAASGWCGPSWSSTG